jgi:hypothetical protein
MSNTTFGPINTVPQTHFKVAHQESDGLAYTCYARKFAYAWDDLDAADDYYIPIDAGTTILSVTHRVTTAFNGGTPSLTVGDSAAVDTWLASTDVTETSLNDLASSATASSIAKPKYYATANYLRICHAASLSAGAGELVVYYGV